MSFWVEIRRRNVVKVAVAYAAVSWLLIQLVTTVEEPLRLPSWFDTFIIVCLAVGLPIALILAWAFELTPEGIRPTESVDREASITRKTGQKLTHITIGVLAIAVTLLLIDRFAVDDPVEAIPNSIAVAPFEDLSPNEEDAYFAISLREEILNQLQKLQNLNVIGEETMRQLQNSDRTLAEIASEMGVEALLGASVSYAEGQVAVNARLIDPQTDRRLWSDTLVHTFENVFEIRSEMAMYVANAMAVEYSIEEQTEIERVPTDSPEAYNLYLEAWAHFLREGPEEMRLALARIDDALAVDPEFALAWVQKSLWHMIAPSRQVDIDQESRHRQIAEEAVQRAIAIDPELPEAYQQLANLALENGNLIEMAQHYQREEELGGDGEIPLQWLGVLGYSKEASERAGRWRQQDPLNSLASFWSIALLDASGDPDSALREYQRGVNLFDLFPNGHAAAWMVLLGREDYRAADALLRDSELSPAINIPILDISDSPELTIETLNELFESDSCRNNVCRQYVAAWAMRFRAHDLALEALHAAIDEDLSISFLFWRELFRDLRELEEFRELIADKGFVDYWREYGWPDHCQPVGANDFACS